MVSSDARALPRRRPSPSSAANSRSISPTRRPAAAGRRTRSICGPPAMSSIGRRTPRAAARRRRMAARRAAPRMPRIARRLLRRRSSCARTSIVLGAELAAGRPRRPSASRASRACTPHCLAARAAGAVRGSFRLDLGAGKAPVEAVLGPISLSAMTTCCRPTRRASSNARAKNAAGCSSTRPRTRAGAGARWKSAAIAPSRSASARRARGA